MTIEVWYLLVVNASTLCLLKFLFHFQRPSLCNSLHFILSCLKNRTQIRTGGGAPHKNLKKTVLIAVSLEQDNVDMNLFVVECILKRSLLFSGVKQM